MKSSYRVTACALCAAASSGLFGCVTSDEDPAATGAGGATGGAAGSAQSGNAGSGGGTSSMGGSSSGQGGGGSTGGPMGTPCPVPTLALMTDFSPPVPAAAGDAGVVVDAGPAAPVTSTSWGDFTTQFSGSTYQYPNGATDMYTLAADFSAGTWHITGAVGNYSGFGVAFGLQPNPPGCNKLDASAFAGIAFDISGSVAAPAPAGSNVQFTVGTAGNDITSAWLTANTTTPPASPTFGRCVPAATQYDNTCASPSFTVPVTSTVTTVEVRWAQLIGGVPNASVNPSELTFMSWVLPAPTMVGTPTVTTYDIDITMDNLRFIEN